MRLFRRAGHASAVCWIGVCLADAIRYAYDQGLVHLSIFLEVDSSLIGHQLSRYNSIGRPSSLFRELSMCGRYTVRTSAARLQELFGLSEVESFELRYNIAPTQSVLVVRSNADSNSRELTWMRWGLVPRWAKDISVGARSINARAETIAEKPTFRDAYAKRRCLVVADGFYEWQQTGKSKQPYFIHFDDHRPFAFAGLWERWQGPTSQVESCTIITTEATSRLTWLHERMPVIIPPESFNKWLRGIGTSSLLTAYTAADLIVQPVSTLVNNVRNDSPECVVVEEGLGF